MDRVFCILVENSVHCGANLVLIFPAACDIVWGGAGLYVFKKHMNCIGEVLMNKTFSQFWISLLTGS